MIEKIKNIINKLFIVITGYYLKRFEETIKRDRYSTIEARKRFNNKPLRIIEIGVLAGENTKSIIKNLNVKEFIGIDPFISYGGISINQSTLNESEEEFMKLMEKNPQIKLIKEFSSSAIKKLKGKFDFIYIDANHEYNFVKEDIENYYSLVKEGGILAGDDVNLAGVLKAFMEFVISNKINSYDILFQEVNSSENLEFIIYKEEKHKK